MLSVKIFNSRQPCSNLSTNKIIENVGEIFFSLKQMKVKNYSFKKKINILEKTNVQEAFNNMVDKLLKSWYHVESMSNKFCWIWNEYFYWVCWNHHSCLTQHVQGFRNTGFLFEHTWAENYVQECFSKNAKTQWSRTIFFWDVSGILLVDILEHGKIVNRDYSLSEFQKAMIKKRQKKYQRRVSFFSKALLEHTISKLGLKKGFQ